MKKLLLLALVVVGIGAIVAQSQVTVTNRGEVVSVYTLENDGMGNRSATMDTPQVLPDLAISDDLTVGDDAAIAGDASVAGTLAVTGVATFTAAPKLTAVTAVSTNTATLTNAPAAGNPVAWANVSIGTNTYVIPLFASE